MSPTLQDVRIWKPRLHPGEELLWVGRPRWHMKLDKTALLFSLPAGGAAIGILLDRKGVIAKFMIDRFGESSIPVADMQNIKAFAALALVYLAFYLYAHMVVSPRFTRYALSSRRAFVRTSFIWPKVREKRLTPGTPIQWDEKPDGSIVFDSYEKNYGAKPKSQLGTASTVKTTNVGFFRINEAEDVHRKMQAVAHGTGG